MSDENDSADNTETTIVHAMTPSEALNPGDSDTREDENSTDQRTNQHTDNTDNTDNSDSVDHTDQSERSEQFNQSDQNEQNDDESEPDGDDTNDNLSSQLIPSADDQVRRSPASSDETPAPTPTHSAPAPAPAPHDEPDTASMNSAIDASHSEFTTAFDIIGEMGDTLEDAKSVFLNPSMVKIDREAFEGYLQNLKKMLPVQLERASALMRQAEKQLSKAHESSEAIIRQAHHQANSIIADARQRADYLSGHEHVTDMARQKADAIIRDAERRAAKISDGSDQYSQDMLTGLSEQLTKLSRDVQGGLQVLDQRREQARAQLDDNHRTALTGRDRLQNPEKREDQ
jgi:vacuolar-type H+-ATPase subunit H